MVATVVSLTSASSTVHYFRREGHGLGPNLPANDDGEDYYARSGDEHRKASRWRGSGAAALRLRGHVEPGEFRARASGIRARHRHPSGPASRRRTRAPPGPGHHAVGAEVGLAGGAAWRSGRGAGDAGARCGGAGDAGFRRSAALADPALEPGGAALGAGERAHAGGGDVPAHHQPQQRPAASHALRDREHDARRRAVAERGDRPAAPVGEADRGLLPQRAGARAAEGGVRAAPVDDRAGSGVRDIGLAAGGAGSVLQPAAADTGLYPGEGLGATTRARRRRRRWRRGRARTSRRRAELEALWRDFAEEHGLAKRTLRKIGVRHAAPPTALEIAWRALEQLEERASVFPARDALALALAHVPGLYRLEDIEGAFSELQRDRHLLPAIRRGVGAAWTTARAVKAEREVLARMRAGKGAVKPLVAGPVSKEALAGLSEGQREAVRSILESRDRVVGVQGHAGSGKTVMLRCAASLVEGRRVLGLAPSASAARTLSRETGLACRTLQWFLARCEEVADGVAGQTDAGRPERPLWRRGGGGGRDVACGHGAGALAAEDRGAPRHCPPRARGRQAAAAGRGGGPALPAECSRPAWPWSRWTSCAGSATRT